MKKLIYYIAAAILSLATALSVHGGSSAQENVGVDKFGKQAIADFATKIDLHLNEREVDVAILARTGRMQEELPEGIRYTHVGIAVYEAVKLPDGKIEYVYTVYNLYQGAGGRKDRSHLVQDFTYDMCAGIAEPRIGVIIPTKKMQRAVLRVLRSPAYIEMHNPSYNLIANPYNNEFDNCVTHTLDVLAAAMIEEPNEKDVRKKIRSSFEAQPLKLGLFQSIGINFMDGATLEDQSGTIKTATFSSLVRFLEDQGALQEVTDVVM